jgi:CHAT domain-containing protein
MKECNNLRKENELLWKELEDVQNELKEKYSFHSESIKKDERIQRNTQELILQLYNQKQALSKKIDENEKHLWVCGDSRSNKSIDPATKRILVKKRDKLIKKQKNLRLEIKNKYPDYYAIKYPEPVELQTIQNDILKPRDVILIYNVIEDKTFVWLISKNNIYFDAINIEQYELREKILSHRKEIEKVYKLTCRQESKSKFLSELEKSNKRIVQMGMDLYNILIPNFIEAIIDRSEFLYIVPTDLLYTFPFETLYAKGKFLIEKNAISYLSSVSLLKTLKFSQLNKIERPAYPILAFANPLYKNTCKDQYEKDSLELQFILEKSPKSNNNTNMKKQIKKKKEETNELSNKKWYPEFDFGLNSSKKQDETFTKLEKLHKIYKKIEQRYHQDKEEGLTLSEINNLLENLVTKIDLNSKKIKPPHKNNDYIMPAKKEMCNKEKGNQFLIPSFNSLEETEHEAKAIIQLFNPPESSKPLQLRKNASRSKVLSLSKTQNLDDYKYIIFSCHGVIPDETTSTNQPALVLSQPDPKSDYCKYLTMSDIFNLKMNADLVTLSACNSGIGTYIRGEGLNGLTRAFMYAGTSSVTVTLWRVSSSSEKVLNIGLFKNLKNNIPKAKALQLIKLSMISGKEGVFYKHPYFWAPVILFGL